MAYRVDVVGADNAWTDAGQFDGLEDAMGAALQLADELGQRPLEAGQERAKKVIVSQGNGAEVSILIMRGGLLGSKGYPKLRSI